MLARHMARASWPSLSRGAIRHSFIHSKPPPFPTVQACPSPTCSCAETPALPEGLEIDHARPLSGTMAAYTEQVLICTGKDDWMSRIEEENSGDNLAADIKELMGRGGMYSDVNPLMYRSSHVPFADEYLRKAISQCGSCELLFP